MNAENLYRAELLRLHGELLFAIAENENFEVAERHFKTAINLATEQQAHCFYIRATASLANLLRRTNRDEQASRLTAPLKDDLSLYATSSELMKRL